MPELPEVEVVRRGVAAHVVGRTIDTVEVLHPRPVRRQGGGAPEFVARATGRTVLDAVRRGKYLWLVLDGEEALLVHLGMSGQLLVKDAHTPADRHLRVGMSFRDDGPQLRFVDQRMFGGMSVVDLVPTVDQAPGGRGERPADDPTAHTIPEPITHIARDPLDPAFDEAVFVRRLRTRRTGLKRALLDQSLVSGIGNIYADEALWRARVHYARATDTLTRPVVLRTLESVREVMDQALIQGGTSFDALYVNVNGQSGYFSRALNAYGREGQPCKRCGTPVRRESFMNRSSYLCPRCQRQPSSKRP
ncbi:MAG: bifunctional DNA-formamidopyrimidine glycosylase/DNA-(apurinic or apyrimidinic site) lyase [Actinomycetales bacterium]